MILVPGTFRHLADQNSTKFGHKGIDRLVLTFPARSYANAKSAIWEGMKTNRAGWSAWTTYGMSGFQVHVTARATVWGVIDLSPASFLGQPTNVHTPDDDSLMLLGHAALVTAADCGLVSTSGPDCLRIARIDLTRDLKPAANVSADLYMRGMASHHPTYSKFSSLYSSPSTGLAKSLRFGSNQRQGRLYVKSRSPGLIRWEGQIRRDSVSAHGLRKLTAVTSSILEAARIRLWQWSGMGTTVVASGSPVMPLRRAVQTGRITWQQMYAVLGGALDGYGFPSRNTLGRYRAAMRDAGLTANLADLSRSLRSGPPVLYRADYSGGTIDVI